MILRYVNCRVKEELMASVSKDHLGLLGLLDLSLIYMMYAHTDKMTFN